MAKVPTFSPVLKFLKPRLRGILLAIFIIGTAAHAAAPDPDLQKSIEFFQAKNYAASRDLLKRLVMKSPRNGLYWFNLGNSNFMLENFRQAELCFAQVEKLQSPLAPAARLYRAKALRAQGFNARAIETLQPLTANPNLPPTLKDAVERERAEILGSNDLQRKNAALEYYKAEQFDQALNEISALKQPDDDALFLKGLILLALNRTNEANTILDGLRRKPTGDLERIEVLRDLTDRIRREIAPAQNYWVSGEALAGANSNVYPGSGADPRAAAVIKAVGAAGARPWRNGAWSASGQARIEWDETLGLGDLKVLSQAAQASLHFDTSSSQTQVSALGEFDFWSNEPVLLRTGLRGRYKQYWNSYELTSELGFLKATAQDSDVSYLGGMLWDGRFYAGRTIFPVYIEFGIDFQRHAIGDQTFSDGSVLPWGFQGWGPGFRLIWKHSDLWLVSAQAHYRMREYFSATLPDGHHRSDHETDVAATLTRILGPRLSAYFSAALVNNASTLGSSDVRNENYSVQTAFIGFLYDVR